MGVCVCVCVCVCVHLSVCLSASLSVCMLALHLHVCIYRNSFIHDQFAIVLTLLNNLSFEPFCLILYSFRELNFKEVEAYNRLQNVESVSLPSITDQVGAVVTDCKL